MKKRTIRATILRLRWIQVKYNYITLETGEKIDRRVFGVLPITDNVIQQVETLGKTQQQPFRASQMLQYEWIPGPTIAAYDANINVPEDEKVYW